MLKYPRDSPESCERKHDGDVTHVTRILGWLFLLLLHSCSASGFDLPGLVVSCLGFSWWRLFMVCLVMMSQILLIFKHLMTVLALEVVIVFMSLFMSFPMGDGVKYDATE